MNKPKKLIIFVLCVFFAVNFIACRKKCSEYPGSLQAYSPYMIGDVIRYISNKDTIYLEVSNVMATEKYTMDMIAECSCECASSFYSGFRNSAQGFTSIYATGDADDQLGVFTWTFNTWQGNNTFILSQEGNPYDGDYPNKVGKVINLTDTKNPRIDQITITWGTGITSFHDKIYNRTWSFDSIKRQSTASIRRTQGC